MNGERVPESLCLNCGKKLDAVTGIRGATQPDPGSLSICIYCGAVMAFDDTLKLRGLTDDEIDEIAADLDLMSTLGRATKLTHFHRAGRN